MMHDDSNQALAAAVEMINIKLHQLIIADSMSDRDPEKTMILLSISSTTSETRCGTSNLRR